MPRTFSKTVPDKMIDLIGTTKVINGVEYIITGVFLTRSEGIYKLEGIVSRPLENREIAEWKQAARSRNIGRHAYSPGQEIGKTK